MRRLVPLMLVPGCLWIGPGAHDERKARMAIRLAIEDVSPDAWSACVDEPPRFVVVGTVAGVHGGQPFDAWFQVEGDERRPLGRVTAGAPADGRAEVSFTLDLTESFALLPACDGACETPITIGLGRLGLEDEADAVITRLADQLPTVVAVDLVDADGVPTELGSVPLDGNPTDSLSSQTWPAVVFELADPHQPVGLGGRVDAHYCPEGADPIVDAASCLVVATESAPDLVRHGGDLAFRTVTGGFGAASCAPPTGRWVLWGVVLDHVCGSPVALELSDPFRFVVPDCDADGSAVPEDCDDADPRRAPGTVEVWYDGVDADCSGGSDDDQDGDGVDGPTGTGPDCDDTNPAVSPGAAEVCDGLDNDCDGTEPADLATLFGAAGTQTFAGAELGTALGAMGSGDELVLCPGSYSGNFTLAVAGTLRSASGDPTDTELVAGSSGDPVLTIGVPGPPIDATVQGLGIRGASAVAEGGGIQALGAATLLLEDCEITGNQADRGGGLAVAGTATLRRTTIASNTALSEGGGIAAAPATTLILEDTVLVTLNAASEGGGLHLEDAVVSADDTVVIEANDASAEGGGVFAIGDLDFTGASLVANEASAGGGFHLEAGADWALTDVVVRDHVVPGVLIDGAGVHAIGDGALTLTRVAVSSNAAGTSGGGLYAASSGAVPLAVTLVSSTFDGNSAVFEGGGVSVENVRLTTRGGTIRDNTAAYGAGVHARASEVVLGNGVLGTDVLDNDATQLGGGLRLVPGTGLAPSLVTDGSDVERNTALFGAGIWIDPDDIVAVQVIDGGALQDNVATNEGGAIWIDDGALQLTGAVAVSGNLPDGVWLVDESVEACAGVAVDDLVTTGVFDQGSLTACFVVTDSSLTVGCGC